MTKSEKSKSKDLTGQQFGKWTVTGPHTQRSSNGGMFWRCKCECGQNGKISSTSLIRGKSTQCWFCGRQATRKRFCAQGHDTELWGRTSSYSCRACLRDKHLRSHYGITLEEFFVIYDFQKGLCAACKKPLGDYRPGKPGYGNGCRIEVDHEHGTKKPKKDTVRGLLCGGRWAGCNRKLGRIDKIDWLTNVLEYLKEPPAQSALRRKET